MKKKIMLIVPMLHQGGFERVCVATARLLEPFYEVYIVIFSSRDIAYDDRENTLTYGQSGQCVLPVIRKNMVRGT